MKRVGRPCASNPKDIRFSIRIDDKTNKALDEYCEQNRIKKAEAIRTAIEQLLYRE